MAGTSKADFEALADMRMVEARALLAAGQFDGAFYVAGYAIECALKAIIAKSIPAHTFPRTRRDVDLWFTHKLDELLHTAGVADAMFLDPRRRDRWRLVVEWNEGRRYERGVAEARARAFCDAIDHPTGGVLPWLKLYW